MKTPAKKSRLWTAILLASTVAASAIQVTYQVDMSEQMTLGNFIPGTDTVFVSGNFSNPTWQQSATDGATNYVLTPSGNPNIYVGTFSITNDPTTFEAHQFVMNPGGNFGGLVWEPGITGGGNRFFEVPSVNTNLPVVYFNDVAPGAAVAAPVTFYVNMSVQQTLGRFNPATDFVVTAGDWMGGNWTAGINSAPSMTPTGTNANVYTVTVNVTNTLNTLENYKFVILSFNLGTIWEGNVNTNSASGNRQFPFPGVATNLPSAFFDNQTNANTTVPVTFQVNLLVENALGVFTPGVDSVYVSGQWNWNGNANLLTQSPSDPNTYTGTVTLLGFSPGTIIPYKYTINGGTIWENNNVGPGGAQNRQFVLPNTATNLPGNYFNNFTNLGTMSISNSSGQAIIKWPVAGTRIRLQNTANPASGWQDVPNTLGSNSATATITGTKFFRAKGP